jgi:hypothetical protein
MDNRANLLILGTLTKNLGRHHLNSKLVEIANDITQVLERNNELASDGVLAHVVNCSNCNSTKVVKENIYRCERCNCFHGKDGQQL